MNFVVLSGRLTKDPDIRTTQKGTKVANYTLAVDRFKDGTDFLRCTCFDKTAEFAEKYLYKGMKIIVNGRITSDTYKNQKGDTVTSVTITVSGHEFCETKAKVEANVSLDGFMSLPETEEELVFK